MSTFRRDQQEKDNIDSFSLFILWFAGIDKKVLQQINRPVENNKYVALGLMIIIACLFAGFSAYIFAKSNCGAIDEKAKIAVSCIWGLFVFAIDRFLLVSFKKKEFSLKRLWDLQFIFSLIFRIALCFNIASFVSSEVELVIFSSEISTQMLSDNSKKTKAEEKQFMSQIYEREDVKPVSDNITKISARIESLRGIASEQEKSYLSEVDGTTGSKKRGAGEIANIKKDAWQKTLSSINQLELSLAKLEIQRKDIITIHSPEIKAKIAEIKDTINNSSGSLSKTKALESYIEDNKEAKTHFYTIKILFALIELMPMVLKILSPYSAYDMALHLEDERLAKLNKMSIDSNTILLEYRISQEEEIKKMEIKTLYDIEKDALSKMSKKISELSEERSNHYFAQYQNQVSTNQKEGVDESKGKAEENNDSFNKIPALILGFLLTGFTGTKDHFVGAAKIFADMLKSMFKR
jgi:Domain of unknown function (DUF4407)